MDNCDVPVLEVVEASLEEEERARGEEDAPEDGNDPRYARLARPPKPEQADWKTERTDHSGWKTVLRHEPRALFELGIHPVQQIWYEKRIRHQATDEQTLFLMTR